MKTAIEKRLRRKFRLRKKLFGTSNKPRIFVFRSLKHVYIQAVNDIEHKPIIGLSSKKLTPENRMTKTELSYLAGKEFANILLKHGITQAVFDRSGYKYHGRVKAVCEGLREGGIRI